MFFVDGSAAIAVPGVFVAPPGVGHPAASAAPFLGFGDGTATSVPKAGIADVIGPSLPPSVNWDDLADVDVPSNVGGTAATLERAGLSPAAAAESARVAAGVRRGASAKRRLSTYAEHGPLRLLTQGVGFVMLDPRVKTLVPVYGYEAPTLYALPW